MTRNLLIVGLLILCVQVSQSALSFIRNDILAGQPQKCFDQEQYYDSGATWHRGSECTESYCSVGKGEEAGTLDYYIIQIQDCPRYREYPANCNVTEGTTSSVSQYPECCPKLTCDGEPNGPISQSG